MCTRSRPYLTPVSKLQLSAENGRKVRSAPRAQPPPPAPVKRLTDILVSGESDDADDAKVGSNSDEDEHAAPVPKEYGQKRTRLSETRMNTLSEKLVRAESANVRLKDAVKTLTSVAETLLAHFNEV